MRIICLTFLIFFLTTFIFAECHAKCPENCGEQYDPLFEVNSQPVGKTNNQSVAPEQKSIINPSVFKKSGPSKKISLAEPQVVKIAEIPQMVVLSNRDLNRIVCAAGEFEGQGLVTSKEKGIDVAILEDRHNAFVKIPITEIDSPQGKTVEYVTEPFELFALCGGTVYTLIVKPKDVSSQTVILQASTEKEALKKNLDLFKGQREAERVCSLAKMAFLDDIPASFEQKRLPQKPLNVFSNLKIVPYREILVKGIGLRLREYFIYPLDPNVHLAPEDFARKEFFQGIPKGVFLSSLRPSPDEPARLFVVESVLKPFTPRMFPFGGTRERHKTN